MSTPAVPGSQLESQLLDADCVIVNADLAAAEPQLLPPALRRSEYAEQSEMTSTERLATIGRTVQRAATAVAVALKTAMGAAVPYGAEVAETMAPPPTTATEGLLRAGGWRYSSSTVSFYWCLDRRYAELRHHNVFLAPADAWRGLFDSAEYARWDERLASAPLHFYVHAPARTDPSCCELPTDDAVMVLVPVPPLDERMSAADVSAATERMVARARDAVIQTFESAGMEGFGATIVDERVRTPPGWRDAYGLRRGSVFGLSHNLEQLALARPARRHKGVRGLHWVGANTRPGNGVPLVLIGAMKTAEEALLDLGIGHR
jgi:phytoene dehydrogenase-like protein